jgi:NTP pyrophosphatase (non-canonical NTP hydrolase)
MAIIVSKNDGGDARIVQKSQFGQELKLQQYIHDHPEAIPVYDIQADKRLFVAAREFFTESGPIDALAFDGDGDIYIVETKLYANPDKRRVVAQMLDYGASLWKHFGSFDKFLSKLNEHTQAKWQCDFRQKVQEVYELTDEEAGELLESIKANLGSGNLKFVVLMDSMEERLKDLITYINQKSQFDIYGVELEYYKHDEYEIVIPKMYGVEVKKDAPPATGKRTFLSIEELAKQSVEAGVGELFEKCVERFSLFLIAQKRGTSGCTFGLRLPDDSSSGRVISLVPGESSAENGLRYRLYARRLSRYLEVDLDTIKGYLPPNPVSYEHYENAPPGFKGWAGYIKSEKDIEGLVELMKLGGKQESSG